MEIWLAILDKNPINQTNTAKLVFGNMQQKEIWLFERNFHFLRLSNQSYIKMSLVFLK